MTQDISESMPPPLRRDVSFYIVLLFLVAPVWSVVPASWAYVAYSATPWQFLTYSNARLLLFALAICEVLFSIYCFCLARKISSPSPLSPADVLELRQGFRRVLQTGLVELPEYGDNEEHSATGRPGSPDAVIEKLEREDPRAIDFRHNIRAWFKHVPWSRVRREHFHQWLYWSTFNTTLPPVNQIPESHRTLIREATELVEKRIGDTIPDGSDPSVQTLRLTIDPISILPRPLVWYIFVKVANVYLWSRYRLKYDLVYGKFKDLEYLFRIPPGYNRTRGPDPVVFVHGLGLGLWQYQRALQHLLEDLPDTPILIPIQPQISQDIFHPRFLRPMLRHEKVTCLAGALDNLGWAGPSVDETFGVTMLSHSNGSYTHAWMLKSFPHLVKRSCFVDPVTFCLWEGDVCYNFVYRPCSTGVELLIRYYVGTELGAANLIQRHFDWMSNTLWVEEIPNARDPSRSLFLLGGKDCIVNTERVKNYLVAHGVKDGLCYDPKGRHGEVILIGEKGINKIIDWIKDFKPSC